LRCRGLVWGQCSTLRLRTTGHLLGFNRRRTRC